MSRSLLRLGWGQIWRKIRLERENCKFNSKVVCKGLGVFCCFFLFVSFFRYTNSKVEYAVGYGGHGPQNRDGNDQNRYCN